MVLMATYALVPSARVFYATHRLSALLKARYSSPLPNIDSRPAAAFGRGPFLRILCHATDEIDRPELKEKEVNFGELERASGSRNGGAKSIQGSVYLDLADKELFAQCKMDTYRASGPGGQHRNKTDSAVRLRHIPTGLVTQACEERSQHTNRALALKRMRQLIALEVRNEVVLEGYVPPGELVRILPHDKTAKSKSAQRVGPNHPDFVPGMKHLLDLLKAVGGSVSDAAAVLGLTTGSLSKVITSDKLLWQGANKIRAEKGLKPLR